MSKAAKLTMIIAGIAAAIVLAAIIVFATTFDINDYKDRIADAVHRETGRTLRFDGDISLSFLPLGVEMDGMSLSNAPGFDAADMVRVNSARVSVQLFPLLGGDVRFGRLELDGLVLNLSRKADGTANWDDMVGRTPTEPEKTGEGDHKSFSLEVDGVSVTNANLVWDDAPSETRFSLNGLTLTTGQIHKGAPFPLELGVDFDCTNPEVKGQLTLTGKSSIDFENRVYGHMDMKATITAEGRDVPGGKGQIELGVQLAALDFKREHAQFTGVTVSGYGLTAHLDGTMDGITDGLRKLAATISLDPADVQQSLADLGQPPLQTADDTALTSVSVKTDMVYMPNSIRLKNIEADVDGTRLTGQARYSLSDGMPEYFARLDAGELDLDRYLPPASTESADKESDPKAQGEPLFDLEVLRRLLLDVEAKCAKLRVKKVWMSNVVVTAKARHGLFRISPVSADLYDGTLSAGVTLNGTSENAKADVIAGLDKVNVGDLSRDALGDDSYAGILNFNSALSCQGETVNSWLRTMNGKVGFHLADGVFPGVDLIKMARQTHADEDKKGTVEAKETDSTRFGSITGTGIITSGVLRNRDLEVKAPGLRAHGEGAIVLPTRQIDYLVKAKLVPTTQGQGGKSTDESFGVMVPIRVGGTLDNPRYWVSLTEYVKALGGAVLDTAGAILGGVKGAVTGVGEALTGGEKKQTDQPEKKGLFGIF